MDEAGFEERQFLGHWGVGPECSGTKLALHVAQSRARIREMTTHTDSTRSRLRLALKQTNLRGSAHTSKRESPQRNHNYRVSNPPPFLPTVSTGIAALGSDPSGPTFGYRTPRCMLVVRRQ